VPLGILDLRVETREKGGAPGRFTLLFFVGLGVDWDVAKKKAVSKSKAPDEAQGNEITEQAAGVMAVAMPKEPESGKPKKEKKQRPVRCIQQHTDVEFRREFREIFAGLAEKAKGGGTAQTRLLLQIGKFGDPKVAKRRGAKCLSEMLLDELKRRQDEREAATDSTKTEELEAQAKKASGKGATGGGDAEQGSERGAELG
jgi:hypothetical protein